MDRFSANSDFELKLVTILSLGICRESISRPSEVMLSRKIGDVIPKLGSEPALFHTLCESCRLGNSPLSDATPHITVTGVVVPGVVVGTSTLKVPLGPAGQPSGSVSPIVTVAAGPVYTVRLSTRLSGANLK